MSRPMFQVVFGVRRNQILEAAKKVQLDENELETLIDSCDGMYHGSAIECSTNYFGVELEMLQEDENFIEFDKIMPQGMDTAKHTAKFNTMLDQLRLDLVEEGVDAEKAKKLKFDRPTAFIAVGTD